jgi:hypothetical protein
MGLVHITAYFTVWGGLNIFWNKSVFFPLIWTFGWTSFGSSAGQEETTIPSMPVTHRPEQDKSGLSGVVQWTRSGACHLWGPGLKFQLTHSSRDTQGAPVSSYKTLQITQYCLAMSQLTLGSRFNIKMPSKVWMALDYPHIPGMDPGNSTTDARHLLFA